MALEHLDKASSTEKALAHALTSRFPVDHTDIDFTASESAYAEAMRPVYAEYEEDDLDVIALSADAIMNSAPRKMFDKHTERPIVSSPVFEVKGILEHGLAKPGVKHHRGIPHLYIHLMEMSDIPHTALDASDLIREMIPDTGKSPTNATLLPGGPSRKSNG